MKNKFLLIVIIFFVLSYITSFAFAYECQSDEIEISYHPGAGATDDNIFITCGSNCAGLETSNTDKINKIMALAFFAKAKGKKLQVFTSSDDKKIISISVFE